MAGDGNVVHDDYSFEVISCPEENVESSDCDVLKTSLPRRSVDERVCIHSHVDTEPTDWDSVEELHCRNPFVDPESPDIHVSELEETQQPEEVPIDLQQSDSSASGWWLQPLELQQELADCWNPFLLREPPDGAAEERRAVITIEQTKTTVKTEICRGVAPCLEASNECLMLPEDNSSPERPGIPPCYNERNNDAHPFSKIRDWFRNNQFVQTIIQEAQNSWSNFSKILNFEDDNYTSDTDPEPEITVVADEDETPVIGRAFQEVFHGRVRLGRAAPAAGNRPALPLGFAAGLQAARARMRAPEVGGLVGVAAASLVVETTPQRWHSCSVVTLEDPRLHLSLHCYGQMTPVPRTYMAQAERRTPQENGFGQPGFGVTLDEVAGHRDWQGRLTGVRHLRALGLAAKSLAGLYKNHLGSELSSFDAPTVSHLRSI